MLKVLLAVVHGLEVSSRKFANGGLTSTFQLLEICHTHYWSKFDLNHSNSKSASPFSSNEHIENSPLLERKTSGKIFNSSLVQFPKNHLGVTFFNQNLNVKHFF